MRRLIILIMIAAFGTYAQGCQSQQDEAAKEKEKNFWKDATPEKYKERQGKPEKPYWEN
jgi:endonuclease YncB( thermonuclease family)